MYHSFMWSIFDHLFFFGLNTSFFSSFRHPPELRWFNMCSPSSREAAKWHFLCTVLVPSILPRLPFLNKKRQSLPYSAAYRRAEGGTIRHFAPKSVRASVVRLNFFLVRTRGLARKFVLRLLTPSGGQPEFFGGNAHCRHGRPAFQAGGRWVA